MPRLRVVPRAGALLIAVLALAACSSSSSGSTAPPLATSPPPATLSAAADRQPGASASPSAASPAADACSLLTPTDIHNATGVAFGNPQAETPQQTQYGSYTACTWLQADAPSTTVRLTVWDDDAAYDDAKQQLGDTNDLGEIGDRAFSATLAAVYAAVDGHTLFVQYSNFDNDDAVNLPVSVELAEVAATNL